jgi:C-terminal processing protease CtpA/Prc
MTLRRASLCAAALVAVAAAPARGQQGRRLDAAPIQVILRGLRSDLEHHYYDTTFHGVDLDAAFRAATERALAADNNHQVFAIIAQALDALDDSHTTFWPPDRVSEVRYGWRPYFLGDTCYVVAVARGSDAERQGVRAGERLVAIDGIRPTRGDAWRLEYLYTQLNPRTEVALRLAPPAGGDSRDVRVQSRVTRGRRIVDLTGSDGGMDIWDLIRRSGDWRREHESEFATVGDSTLVWRLPTFAVDDDAIDEGARRARRARTLILDLRGNQGGYERAVLRLIGDTFRGDVEVGTLRRRKGSEPLRARAREAPYLGRIIVLVDGRSASAAEIYAGTLQRLGRGTVLGDRTSGAVMRSRVYGHQVGGQFAVLYAFSVTDAEIVLGDSLRLERRGVFPDETVLPTGVDIASGRDPVLSRALALAGVALDPLAAGRLLRRDWRGIELW